MTPRRSTAGLLLATALVAILAAGTALAVSACSSSEDEDTPSADASADAVFTDAVVADGETRDPDSAAPETAAECFARCQAAHPGAVARYDAIDVCWDKSCKGPCLDLTGEFDAGGAPGDGGPRGENDGGTNLCGTIVSSAVDRACDDCTETFCCPSWKGCYDDADCLDYNRCVNTCP